VTDGLAGVVWVLQHSAAIAVMSEGVGGVFTMWHSFGGYMSYSCLLCISGRIGLVVLCNVKVSDPLLERGSDTGTRTCPGVNTTHHATRGSSASACYYL